MNMMARERSNPRMSRRLNGVADTEDFSDGAIQASASETAEYLAHMASELVLLARNARLERLSVLLDLVRREAESASI